MPIRAISFDLFDTLIDAPVGSGPIRSSTEALYEAVTKHCDLTLDAFIEALRSIDSEFRSTRYARGFEVATEERFARLIERLEIDRPNLPEALTEIHMGVIRSCVTVPAHHVEVLQALKNRVPLGLCSNFSHSPTAYEILEDAELRAHLDPIAISVDVGLRKPRREMFDAVLGGLGATADETLHVGDSLRADVAGAAQRGMRTAWITRCVPDPDVALAAFEGPRPEFIIADLRELIPRVSEPV